MTLESTGQRRKGPPPPYQHWGPRVPSMPQRTGALERVRELAALMHWIESLSEETENPGHAFAKERIKRAQSALSREVRGPSEWMLRRSYLLGLLQCAAAEGLVLNAAPMSYLVNQVPDLVSHAESSLRVSDRRLIRLQQLAAQLENSDAETSGLDRADRADRATIVNAVQAASDVAIASEARLAGIRQTILATFLLTVFVAALLALVGLSRPSTLPMCFATERSAVVELTCPILTGFSPARQQADDARLLNSFTSPADILLVELAGLTGAALSVSLGLRRHRATSLANPGLSVPLHLLKLALGSIFAVCGILLLRADPVPSIDFSFDNRAQIFLWSLVFGLVASLFMKPFERQIELSHDQGGETLTLGRAAERDEVLLRQVTLAVPSIGPRLQESLIDSVLGAPSPPYSGFVCVEIKARDKSRLTMTRTRQDIVVRFTTREPTGDVVSPIRVEGVRWPATGADEAKSTLAPSLQIEIRLHVPDSSPTPAAIRTVTVPTTGQSDPITFESPSLAAPESPSGTEREQTVLEISQRGRVLQLLELPGTDADL